MDLIAPPKPKLSVIESFFLMAFAFSRVFLILPLHAFVFLQGYRWFVLPLFPQAPQLSVLLVCGLAIMVAAIRPTAGPSEKCDDPEHPIRWLVKTTLGRPLVTWGGMWLIHLAL